MKNKTNLILLILLIVIFGLILYIIFKEPIKTVEAFDEGPLREKIRLQDSTATYWKETSEAWKTIATKAEAKVDSLEQLKPGIYEDHDGQINFNANASDSQLDSVIRANW
jgi:hypothetical protein